MATRLKEKYLAEAVSLLCSRSSATRTPCRSRALKKVIINMGLGDLWEENAKMLENAVDELGQIAGQKPLVTKAKKSVFGGFKLREGMNIGCKVTLRGEKMYQFLDKLINIALPRVRDFPRH